MKGQFKIYKKVMQEAASEGLQGISKSDIAVLDQMSGADANQAIREGALPQDRVRMLSETSGCPEAFVKEVVADFLKWLKRLANPDLAKYGIKEIPITDGVSLLSYDESIEMDVDGSS